MNNFKTKADLHIARKLWHFLGVMLIIVLFNLLTRTQSIIAITFFASLFICVDVFRLNNPKVNKFATGVMKPFMRESERNSIAGTTYLLSAAFIIILFFPAKIVTLSLLFLAIADPVASMVGFYKGKDKLINNKSLQGSLAAFFCCFLISYFFYFKYNIMTERIFLVAVISALIGALSELIPIGKLDDNFTLPVMSAVSLWFLFYVFGAFV